MQYMGSKARHAKHILPIILEGRAEGQYYVEPFVGGANTIDKVDGKRLAGDLNPHLISLLSSVANGWNPPEFVTEEEYKSLKSSMAVTPEVAFAGFLCSFGAKWFGGYARNSKGTNYAAQGMRALQKQRDGLRGIDFRVSSYEDLEIPESSIIYCDPPYKGTTGYSTGKFDHDEFWEWCRSMVLLGHSVFVSEYSAPDDFVSVWSREASVNFDSGRKSGKSSLERLFVHELQHNKETT